jgi:hypothetical protein
VIVEVPDYDGRKEVIEYYLDKVRHSPAISLDRLASDMIGYTPVKIKARHQRGCDPRPLRGPRFRDLR